MEVGEILGIAKRHPVLLATHAELRMIVVNDRVLLHSGVGLGGQVAVVDWSYMDVRGEVHRLHPWIGRATVGVLALICTLHRLCCAIELLVACNQLRNRADHQGFLHKALTVLECIFNLGRIDRFRLDLCRNRALRVVVRYFESLVLSVFSF